MLNKRISDWCEMNGVSYEKRISDWCKMSGVSYEEGGGKFDTYYVFEKHLDLESDEGVSFAMNSLFSEQNRKSKVTISSFFCENPEFHVTTVNYIAGVLLGQ